jgi:hypothetical protein
LPSVADRPVRIQLFVALLVGLVLVATALYLWRRPSARADATPEGDTPDAEAPLVAADPAAMGDAAAASTAAADAGSPNGISLSEPRVVSCRDHGKKKSTAPEDCDHPEELEQALARAIEEAATCIPTSAGGGTIEYQADVTFTKKKSPVSFSVAKKGGSMKNAKALTACGKAVKRAVQDLSVEGMNHEHARYTIAITATYPGPLRNR